MRLAHKWHESCDTRPLDSAGQMTLVTHANARVATRVDTTTALNITTQDADIFVIHMSGMCSAEAADETGITIASQDKG